jgi:hypothetical protein
MKVTIVKSNSKFYWYAEGLENHIGDIYEVDKQIVEGRTGGKYTISSGIHKADYIDVTDAKVLWIDK